MNFEKFSKKRILPTSEEYDVEESEYAGKEPEFSVGEMMMTTSDKKVRIMQYLKDKGLYVVMNIDKLGEVSPAYKVNPDKIKRIETEDKETLEPKEKILNPEEIEELGGDMSEYVKGLKTRIDEIEQELKDEKLDENKKSELESELEELGEQYEGLKEMVDDIQSGDFEEITEKPIK